MIQIALARAESYQGRPPQPPTAAKAVDRMGWGLR
jgi:hypothetical protein